MLRADIDALLDVLVNNEGDLDAYVALIEGIDYDDWERHVRELAGGKLSADTPGPPDGAGLRWTANAAGAGPVICRERVGGHLRFYHRQAA